MGFSSEEKVDMARSLIEGEPDEKVLEFCTKIISEDPNNADAYFLRAEIYFNMGNYQKAISDFNRVLSLDKSKYEIVYSYRGDAYFYSDKYKQALTDYTKAIKLGYGDEGIFANRGWIYGIVRNTKRRLRILTAQLK